MQSITKKLFNPKSQAPAVYIPCWLIQVSNKLLSHGAKLLYGRLAQWCNTSGSVYRSAPQLSKELCTSIRTIERYIKELKDAELIGTFHPQAGGLNHFEFYHHQWMDAPIIDELAYKEVIHNQTIDIPRQLHNPPTTRSVPPDNAIGTPLSGVADINIKEIKEIKCVCTDQDLTPVDNFSEQTQTSQTEPPHTHFFTSPPNPTSPQDSNPVPSTFSNQENALEHAQKLCLNDLSCQNAFNEHLKDYEISLEILFVECMQYYLNKKQSELITPRRFLQWIITTKPQLKGYKKKRANINPMVSSTPANNIDWEERDAWNNQPKEVIEEKRQHGIQQIGILLNKLKTT